MCLRLVVLSCAVISYINSQSCKIPADDRQNCGNYSEAACRARFCCYNSSDPAATITCYHEGLAWQTLGQFQYAHSENIQSSFNASRDACAAEGGELASIDSEDLQVQLMQRLLPAADNSCERNRLYWIGARRLPSCQGNSCWTWLDSRAAMGWSNWYIRLLPENNSVMHPRADPRFDRAVLSACFNYSWISVDVDENYPYRYLCKRDPSISQTTESATTENSTEMVINQTQDSSTAAGSPSPKFTAADATEEGNIGEVGEVRTDGSSLVDGASETTSVALASVLVAFLMVLITLLIINSRRKATKNRQQRTDDTKNEEEENVDHMEGQDHHVKVIKHETVKFGSDETTKDSGESHGFYRVLQDQHFQED